MYFCQWVVLKYKSRKQNPLDTGLLSRVLQYHLLGEVIDIFLSNTVKVGRELEIHHFINRINNVFAGFKQVWAALTIDVFRCGDRQKKVGHRTKVNYFLRKDSAVLGWVVVGIPFAPVLGFHGMNF